MNRLFVFDLPFCLSARSPAMPSFAITRRAAALAVTAVLAAPLAAWAQTPIKFQLDWSFEGPSALFLASAAKGYYKAAGLDVTIDAGNGSGGTVTRVAGGAYDRSKGWYIQPTIVETKDPNYRTLCEELFGPLLTVYVYDDAQWTETLKIVDTTSPYALTGAVFSRDRQGVREAMSALRNAAGNFYINDKPTGAVVGQQPFGGARGSGTNDKAGSKSNLMRWVSTRTVKETFSSPLDWTYPFLG
jgi:hypothetical protein